MAAALRAVEGLSGNGVMLAGSGFIVTNDEASSMGWGSDATLDAHIRAYRNGKDLTDRPRGVRVIDLFGMQAEEVRARFPEVYQWVVERVKPDRDQNNRPKLRNQWWIFGEPRRLLRESLQGLARYIATVETSKHRHFQFLDQTILPDHKVIALALSDAFYLGVLSSKIHVDWSLAAGSCQDPGDSLAAS